MSSEELLKPRYKVIADYPKSDFEIGQVIIFNNRGRFFTDEEDWESDFVEMKDGGHFFSIRMFEHFPHLFKKLEWWEERKPEDMPEYVRIEQTNTCMKVKKHFFIDDPDCLRRFGLLNDEDYFVPYKQCLPSTKEEYDLYIQKSKT